MNKKLNIFISLASSGLKPYHKKIGEVIKQALERIEERLPIPLKNLDIVIYDNHKGVVPELGIGGLAATNNLSIITLNPDFRNFNQTLTLHLPKFLAHELHHILRKRELGVSETLLDILVLEGLADSFSNEVFPGITYPWCRALKDKEFKTLLEKAKKELDSKKEIRPKWLLGKIDKDVPRWAGYTIGFRLIQKYIEVYGSNAANLYNVPSEKFKRVFSQI